MIEPIYQAETSLLIPKKENSINKFFNSIGSDLEGLNFDSGLLSQSSNNIKDLISVLKSYSIAEKVINSLNIKEHPEVKIENKDSFQAILEEFREKVKIISPKLNNNTLMIKVRFKDKYLAKKIVSQYLFELEDYMEKNSFSKAKKNRVFLEKRLDLIKTQLKKSENDLLFFKNKNKTVSLNEETKLYIEYLSELEAEELKANISISELNEKISGTKKNISEFNNEAISLIEDLKINLKSVQARKKIIIENKNKYLKIISSLPIKTLHLARLQREAKLKNTLYLFFIQQLEIAKINESKELDLFKVLDKPYVLDKPIFPKKLITILVMFAMSIILSFLLVVFLENIKKEV